MTGCLVTLDSFRGFEHKPTEKEMDLPDIRKIEVKGKRVLVRADLNVPMENGKIADDSRLRAVLPTFRDIVDRGGRLIVIAHPGTA